MTFYLINLLFTQFLGKYLYKKNKKYFWIFIFFDLFIIAALRGFDVGNDMSNYQKYYNYFHELSFLEIISGKRWGLEIGYALLNKLCSIIFFDFRILIIVTSFIEIIGIIYFCKNYSKDPNWSLWMYICLFEYQYTFTRIRQCIAIAIALQSIKYIKERNLKMYILTILIASLFHRTALCMILLYPLVTLILKYNSYITTKNKLLFALILLIFFLVRVPVGNFVLSFFDRYVSKGVVVGEGSNLLLVYSIGFLIVLYLTNFKQIIYFKNSIFILSFFLMTFFQSLTFSYSLFNRIGEYFLIVVIFTFPSFIFTHFNRKYIKYIKYTSMIVVGAFYIYLLLTSSSTTIPYKFL